LTIVAVGASAGGLEAFTQLLRAVPANTGMGFVFVQHLNPVYRSALPELLAKETTMPVLEATNGATVQPDHVYVIPPNASLSINRRRLRLSPRAGAGLHTPVDGFMESLARAQRSQAVGVVLSGTASDGTRGLTAIKSAGGVTFVQDEKSAKYSGMPRSAIASGSVDFVLPPDKIASELARLSGHSYLGALRAQPSPTTRRRTETDLENFAAIFALLREAAGVDFSRYKPGVAAHVKARKSGPTSKGGGAVITASASARASSSEPAPLRVCGRTPLRW
jgi:two-component system CheB/CheR fusion protein